MELYRFCQVEDATTWMDVYLRRNITDIRFVPCLTFKGMKTKTRLSITSENVHLANTCKYKQARVISEGYIISAVQLY